jgi:hypothetical protein
MKMQIKTWGKIAIALCVFVPTLLSSAYYAQTQGICLKAGRVLSEDELRKTVLANIVNHRIKQAFQFNQEWKGNTVVGINSPAQETDLWKLIEASYNNGKSFEENFGLKILLNGREQKKYEPLKSSQLREPFLAIDFDTRRGGYATIFISSRLNKIAFSDLTPELKEAAREKITWYNKFLGFGNHYFDSDSSFRIIERECCDNRNSGDEDYLHRKKEAYDLSLSKHKVTHIRMISNCGDILLSKNGEIASLNSKYNDENDD